MWSFGTMAGMTSAVRHITFDVAAPHEPYLVAQFWSLVVGRPVSPDDKPDDDEVLVDGEPGLLFIRVPEAKTLKNRVHLDLQPDSTRDEEVERLVALGAQLVDDQRRPDGTGWVVLADPSGNEFCVERSPAERA
jgi:predicted enzyme related to lactoylglutathione lyase